MFKNKNGGKNSLYGEKIRKLRLGFGTKLSQKGLAYKMQLIDKAFMEPRKSWRGFRCTTKGLTNSQPFIKVKAIAFLCSLRFFLLFFVQSQSISQNY